jgi:hypothetical protein
MSKPESCRLDKTIEEYKALPEWCKITKGSQCGGQKCSDCPTYTEPSKTGSG